MRQSPLPVSLLLACLLWSMPATAIPDWQIHAHFKTLGISEGLSQSSVTDLIQDRYGFLWIATQDGLNRYDGYEFVQYKHSPDDANSLSDNWLTALAIDQRNRLWVGTNGQGLNSLDLATGTVARFSPDPDSAEKLKKVYTLYRDSRGRLWIGTFGAGIAWMEPATDTLRWVRLPEPLAPGTTKIWSITEFDGAIWAGTDSGTAIRIGMEDGATTSVRIPDTGAASGEERPLRALTVFGDQLIGAARGGATVLATKRSSAGGERGVPAFPQLPALEVFSLFSDDPEELWLGTMEQGLFRYRADAGKASHYLPGEQKEETIGGGFITKLFRDRSGILWVGTDGAGLSRFDPAGLQFGHYNRFSTEKKLADNVLYAFGESLGGELLIGTENSGLQAVDPASGKSRYLHTGSTPEPLSHDTVRAIATGPGGEIWVGTAGGGLDRLGPDLSRRDHFDAASTPALPDNWVLSLLFDANDRLWIGTYNGLVRADLQPALTFSHDASERGALSNNIITCLYEDRRGRIWIGTWGKGLHMLVPDSGHLRSYRARQDSPAALSNDRVWSITETGDGRIWVGTDGGGLNSLDPGTGVFRHYSETDGLANDVVYGSLPDNAGHLWLSTNKGLSRFRPETGEFVNFGAQDGIQALEFNAGAYRKLANGELLFGGINGFNKFLPAALNRERAVPDPVVTRLLLFNRPVTVGDADDAVLRQSVFATKDLELDHRQNVFSLEFSGMYFANPEKMEYQYKLENFDEDWIVTTADNRRVTYTNLDGGSYRFLLKARQGDGGFSAAKELLKIRILPPPWRTWWAYLLYLLAATSIIGLYVRSLRKKIAREQDINRQLTSLQSELIETRMLSALGEMASSVAHGIRNPLASIRSSAELIESTETGMTAESGRDIIDQVDRLTTWVKQLLAFRQDESASFSRVDVGALLEDCFSTYSMALEKTRIDYQIRTAGPAPEIEADPVLLGQAFNNLIANAIEAMPAGGSIDVVLLGKPEGLQVVFGDDGPGIAEDILEKLGEPFNTSKKEGLGVGLMLVKRILRRHRATLEVVRPSSGGTNFIVSFRNREQDGVTQRDGNR